MDDEYYLNDVEDVKNYLESVYQDEHPEFVISPRITQFLFHIMVEEYHGVYDLLEPDNTELGDFLKEERFIDFIKDRQPNISMVPDNVIDDIVAYFSSDISGFTPLRVCRHSNHPKDSYLYSVIARKDNDNTIACWSTFNESIKSLNHGHFNLASESDAVSIIKQNYFDITDDMEHFGPEASMTDVPEEKLLNTDGEKAEIMPFRHRSR